MVLGLSPLCERLSKWASMDKHSRAHTAGQQAGTAGCVPSPVSGYGEGEGPSGQARGWSTGPPGKGQGIPLVKWHRKKGGLSLFSNLTKVAKGEL